MDAPVERGLTIVGKSRILFLKQRITGFFKVFVWRNAMDRDDLWLVEHFSELVSKYAGKYIAVVNERVVAVGESGTEVEAKAREMEPHKIPSVLRVPREEDMACLLSNSLTHLIKTTFSQ